MNRFCIWLFLLIALPTVSAPSRADDLSLRVAGPDAGLIAAGTGRHAVRVEIESTAEVRGARVVAEARDYEDASVVARGEVEVPSGTGRRVVLLPLTFRQPGIYPLTVRVLAHDGGEMAKIATTFAVVLSRGTVGPSDIGVCTHFAQGKGAVPQSLDLIKLAGIARIRDEVYWDAVEKQPGVFAFPPAYDAFVNAAIGRGLAPLIVLGYSNGQAYPQLFRADPFPDTPETRGLFAGYARECVRRYGDRVKQWELWNEPKVPPARYAELLKAVYPAVKQTRPDVEVISCGGGGAGGGPGGDYLGGILGAGGLESQDGFSIHPYVSPPDNYDLGYPTIGSVIRRVNIPVVWQHLQGTIDRNAKKDGSKLTLWVTELGTYASPIVYPQKQDPALMQGLSMARALLLSRRYGTAKAIFWYDFQDDGVDPQNIEHNFGMIRADFAPKPAYVACATLTETVGSRPWKKSFVETDDVKALQFGDDSDAVIAVWTTRIAPQTVTIPLPPGAWIVRDWQGREHKTTAGPSGLTLDVTPLPQYLLRR